MTSEFERASVLEATTEGLFRAEVPDGWQQGRGAFGGLVLGMMARAMERHLAEPARRLRTLSGELNAPLLVGPCEVRVEVLRRGNALTNAHARVVQGGQTVALASGVFSLPRAPDLPGYDVEPPERADWDQLPVLPIEPPLGPAFAHAYEYRCTGPLPFEGGHAPETAGWVREKTAPTVRDAASVVALLDAWWPTLYSRIEGFRPCATVSSVSELLVDPAEIDPTERLFYSARMLALRDGMFLESRALWDGDVCVAANQQTFAVIK